MDAKKSLESAVDRIRAMASSLNSFMADSEKVFLGTGAKLQHLEDDANRLLTESSNATRMGDGTANPTESLRKGLAHLDQHFEKGQAKTEHGLRTLSAVLAGIENLSSMESDFQRIVATLHALASATHLENSRRDVSQGGFDTVVTDLRSMAVKIKPKFNEVLTQGRQVRMTAQSALEHARTFLASHRRDVANFRKETQTHLATMTGACNTSYTLANKSTESVAKVRTNIGKVLQALQIQDIARQMLEHIVQNLEEFAISAQETMDASGADGGPQSWLAELAVVSRVEAAQVGNACDRLVAGLSQIDNSLRSIASTLTTLAKECSSFSGNSGHTSILRQLEHGIRATTQALRAHDAQEDSMVQVLGNVSETTAGMEALVDEVSQLGRDARFIGLNAMVKAVRVGQAGLTLTVLAREIQDISEQIQTFTTSAATIMESIGNESRALVSASTAVKEPAQGDDAVAANLDSLMMDLGNYQSSLGAAVSLLLAGSGDLRSEITTISKDLHRLTEDTTQLRNISKELSDIHRQAMAGACGAQPPPSRLHAENGRHTMEEERQVQRVALDGHAPASTVEISKPADESSSEGSIEFF
jgi:chromosome segregation ATPase